ncbi:RNase LS, bacterial toxin [anaerobic digester metagenome]
MSKSVKIYAVKSGHKTGIFDTWAECQAQISGFSGAEFKAFSSRNEAEGYLAGIDVYSDEIKQLVEDGTIVAFCDGSFDDTKKRYSYAALIIDPQMTEHEICGSAKNEKYLSAKNVIGEILGAINAMDWAVSHSFEKLCIFHDYEGVCKWITGEWNANSDAAKMYVNIYNSKYNGIIDVSFKKVKGHSNNLYNDKVDSLAKSAIADNKRMAIKGDSWIVINNVNENEIDTVLELIKEEHGEVSIAKEEKPNSKIFRLTLKKKKVVITTYKGGTKKLLIQGTPDSLLFQIVLAYFNELLELNADQVFASAYRTSIDRSKIDGEVQTICPLYPADYPAGIKRLIRQSVINLEYFIESEDYTQYAFPALKALEGHTKYLLKKSGIHLDPKEPFGCFIKQNGKYDLNPIHGVTEQSKAQITECYNFFNQQRHSLFHFGDVEADTTRYISHKNEVDIIIKKCLEMICRE